MKINKDIFIKNKLKILLYFLIFFLLLGMGNTYIYNINISPFSISLIFCLLYINFNGYILSAIYLLVGLLNVGNINMVVLAVIVSIIISIIQVVINIKKISLKKLHIFIFSTITYLLFLLINLSEGKENLALIVSIILGLLLLYSLLIFCDGAIKNARPSNLNIDEKIAGCVFLIVLIIGSSYTNIWCVNLGLVFISLILLFAMFVTNLTTTFVLSIVVGFAYSVSVMNLLYVSLFLVVSIISAAFKCYYKIFSSIAFFSGYIILSIVFQMGMSVYEALGVLCGCLIFVLIPSSVIDGVCEYFDNKTGLIVKNIIDRTKKQIVNRINKLSNVFKEMTSVYRNMVKGSLSDKEVLRVLKEELMVSVCDKCNNKNECFRKSGTFVDHSMNVFLESAYTKGKVVLTDIPASLGSNCTRVNELINFTNQLLNNYHDYSTAISNLDTSRVLIADQLLGVSRLLENLSTEVDVNINFDGKFENRIKEDLGYKNIICLECAVYEKDSETKIINLIIKNECINNNEIEKVVGRIVGLKLMIVSISQTEIIGASLVVLCVRPNYDMVFGLSKLTKTGGKISGDNHSVVKIDTGKYMVSICDGMGSGNNANKISSLTVNLIENFYKAGFDNEIILSSVNKLLALSEEENFSTIDLCVIDCIKNTYDFVKLGATNGYIKRHKSNIEIIKSNGLPVGMLEEISPHITKRLISPFDILVFMSDGVADAFEGKVNVESFLYNNDIINPQALSDEILNKALEINGNIAKDDMTVICVRLFEWV